MRESGARGLLDPAWMVPASSQVAACVHNRPPVGLIGKRTLHRHWEAYLPSLRRWAKRGGGRRRRRRLRRVEVEVEATLQISGVEVTGNRLGETLSHGDELCGLVLGGFDRGEEGGDLDEVDEDTDGGGLVNGG